MITNLKGGFRKPRILSDAELNQCINEINQKIDELLKSGEKTFNIRTFFGGENWDWGENGFVVQIVYDKWYKHYKKANPSWPKSDWEDSAYIQSGITVGNILKYTVNLRSEKFKMSCPRRSLEYTLV